MARAYPSIPIEILIEEIIKTASLNPDGKVYMNAADWSNALNTAIHKSETLPKPNSGGSYNNQELIMASSLSRITNVNSNDVKQGMARAIDQNLTDGGLRWLLHLLGHDVSHAYEDEYSYYLGKVAGDVISIAIGGGMSLKGLARVIGAVGGGASITVLTGGSGAILGGAVAVAGVAIGSIEIAVGGAVSVAAINNLNSDFDRLKNAAKGSRGGIGSNSKMTSKEATEAAKSLGYEKVNELSHGQPVYKKVSGNGPKYITPDVDSHSGGVWKGANSIKDLASKNTRLGTYNGNLKWIGD